MISGTAYRAGWIASGLVVAAMIALSLWAGPGFWKRDPARSTLR